MRLLQAKIIADLHVQPVINAKDEIDRTIAFLKNYLIANPQYKSYVLAISGGQDSTLTGKLARIAINQLRQETGNDQYEFIAVRQPYGEQADEEDAQTALKFVAPDQTITTNIKEATDALTKTLRDSGLEVDDMSRGSIKPKMRMIAQYAVAREHDGVVLGTDHAAEAFAGFFTKYGDGGTDLDPLWRLDKSQGQQMLKALNAPESLYNKVPSADLEDERPQLPDEVALGVKYKDIDKYLEGREVSEEAAKQIEKLYLTTKHKRHLPVTIYDTWWY
ncbi:NH(3)-dependent NAD(+) synthetase [Oenococcus oeni]|uniref:ammonia-dependent NAD(+) synthetase n=1 Tax=Oenococcus oeni TaxID=1247 RepID=UPI00107BE0EA|nr:ammonia-dependent NAD(+) synthetase [Oenococcus oeni]AVI93352.1 NAD(+) synthetase [Oenococcus oeni]SYV98504.1 NH(3)-dependent NAD(+) synthetase [Oenococcus oeni]SYW03987.1 NH(3)-dependent NAD(+) synthetase [Oenococcus oeni]SYW18965.1 NH(3)-dependent NAD(+) synthetase [Oenococcus oeni]VDC13733.1 NH(3)-dependent NAD(+) synthetase [Oenococcus oeni]